LSLCDFNEECDNHDLSTACQAARLLPSPYQPQTLSQNDLINPVSLTFSLQPAQDGPYLDLVGQKEEWVWSGNVIELHDWLNG
jgi:hypothetical protein